MTTERIGPLITKVPNNIRGELAYKAQGPDTTPCLICGHYHLSGIQPLLTPPVFRLATVTFTLYAKATWEYLKFSNYAVLPLTSGSFHMQISCSGMFFLLLLS